MLKNLYDKGKINTPSPYYTFRDAVFESVQNNPRLNYSETIRLSTFADGTYAREIFRGDSATPVVVDTFDANAVRTVRFLAVSARSTFPSGYTAPQWANIQIGIYLSSNSDASFHEITGVTPDRKLFNISDSYREVTPSVVTRLMAKPGDALTGCQLEGLRSAEVGYLTRQVRVPFKFTRSLPTPGNPKIEYNVYGDGVVLRTDFRGTEVLTVLYDPQSQVRRVYDQTSKSVSTYPWTESDTTAWREIIDFQKSGRVYDKADKPDEKLKEDTLDLWKSYTERGPSDTYRAYQAVIHTEPEQRYLNALAEMDATYKQGQEDMAARASAVSCPVPKDLEKRLIRQKQEQK